MVRKCHYGCDLVGRFFFLDKMGAEKRLWMKYKSDQGDFKIPHADYIYVYGGIIDFFFILSTVIRKYTCVYVFCVR